jgi:hypothetical protein
MCYACTEDELRATEEDLVEAEKNVARYAKALSDIVATSEAYMLFTHHLDPLTKSLLQDIAKNYSDIATKALEDADD